MRESQDVSTTGFRFHHANPACLFWIQLSRAAKYDVHAAAGICGLSIRQLERVSLWELGRPPKDWFDNQRMVAARYLLLEVDSIKRVALELSFHDQAHFSQYGGAFLYYGKTAPLDTLQAIYPNAVGEPTPQNGQEFGFSVSGAKDLNGDGYDDVIVGSPYFNGTVSGTTYTAGGAVYFYLAAAGGYGYETGTSYALGRRCLYTGGTAGGHCDHRDPGCAAVAWVKRGETKGSKRSMP